MSDTHHAHSTENKTIISFKNSFWLVVILVGLFIAALNFVQAESAPAAAGHGGHDAHGAPAHADHKAAADHAAPAGEAHAPEAHGTEAHAEEAPKAEQHKEEAGH
jgi:hypothetical protein